MPTGSAVVADIIDLTRNILAGSPGRVPLPPEQSLVELRPHSRDPLRLLPALLGEGRAGRAGPHRLDAGGAEHLGGRGPAARAGRRLGAGAAGLRHPPGPGGRPARPPSPRSIATRPRSARRGSSASSRCSARSGDGMVATELRVIYGDTDQMGVVYYANYLRYFEAGRNEFIRAKGLRYRDFEATYSLRLPVTEASVRYQAPARYDDLLRLETSLEDAASRLGQLRLPPAPRRRGGAGHRADRPRLHRPRRGGCGGCPRSWCSASPPARRRQRR